MNKRGLSMIITTLILVVLVLVAVAIIWVVVNNILKGGTEGIALGKFTLDAGIKNVNIDNSSNNVSLTVKRNPGKGELSGMKFIFYDGTNSEIITEENMTLKELEQRRFNFHLINLNVDNLIRISIVPIFKSESGKEIMGNVVDTYNVKDGVGCIVNCTDKECGSDGCGGICGDCVILHGDGWYCQSGTCIEGTNPCVLTSASWNETNVVEGTLVTLNVAGTDCTGIDLNYTIWEDDALLNPDDFADSFIATGLSTTWIAEWQDDTDGGQSNPPEYYFIARVVGETEEITSSDPLLEVTSLPVIICGDNVIEGTEVCDGTDLSPYTSDCSTYPGFDGGTLACYPSGHAQECTYDTSGCTTGGTGLIAYYPFNGNANDESGNGNDGDVTGATLTTDKDGNPNSAFQFDGVDDYINGTISELFRVDKTITAWIKIDSISRVNNIFHIGNELSIGTPQTLFRINADNRLASYGLKNGVDNDYLESVETVSADTWYFVAFVNDVGSNSYKLYLGANEVNYLAGTTGTYEDRQDNLNNYFIGVGYNNEYFQGIIDEVRIYNRALNDSEIVDLSGIIITECNDEIDNDGNGCADYPDDLGCTNADDNDESGGTCATNIIYALSCSYTDVQNAIDSAVDGDTVVVPSGECVWDTTLTITKGITLQGIGSDYTVITANAIDTRLMRINPGSNKAVRVTGFGFIGGEPITIVGDKTNSYVLDLVRIDHNKFVDGRNNVYSSGWIESIIDHNEFLNCNRAILIVGDNDYAWSRPIEAGSEHALFIEDNTFKQTNAGGGGLNENIYHQEGARTVIRYNDFDGTEYTDYSFVPFDSHGNQASYYHLGGQLRSQPILEIYNNTFDYHHTYRIMYIRGGSSLIFNNIFNFVTSSTEIQFSEEEAWQSSWWGGVLRTEWPAEDQIMNTFIWDNTANGNPITDVSINFRSSNCLGVDNPYACCTGAGTGTCNDVFIQKDRDYFMNAPQSSEGYEYYTGRQGASNTTPTDGGTDTMLFSASGANAYYPYTPYTYPHPLTLIP